MLALQIAVIAALLVLVPAAFVIALYVVSLVPYVRLSPPFVPTDRRLLGLIADALAVTPDSTMYELGAGDMRISLACFAREPAARYTGLEKHLWPRMLARYRIWRAGAAGRVAVRDGDLYAADLRDATHVYCYLFPEPMARLSKKFGAELPPGAVVVSLDFPMRDRTPVRMIDLTPYCLRLGKTLYVYRF